MRITQELISHKPQDQTAKADAEPAVRNSPDISPRRNEVIIQQNCLPSAAQAAAEIIQSSLLTAKEIISLFEPTHESSSSQSNFQV